MNYNEFLNTVLENQLNYKDFYSCYINIIQHIFTETSGKQLVLWPLDDNGGLGATIHVVFLALSKQVIINVSQTSKAHAFTTV